MEYALDLTTPVRHVATEMDRAGDTALSIEELVDSYAHANTGDIARVRKHEHVRSDREATRRIIEMALAELSRYIANGDGSYRLSVPFDQLRYKRKKLHRLAPRARFEGSFDPMRGTVITPDGAAMRGFSEDIRDLSTARDKTQLGELRDSMREFGWIPEFPALKDERGVVLVGHRRLSVAAELGIDPIIKILRIGEGDEADARRFKIAIASNIGQKTLTPSDRQRIAEYLYGKREWTMERIAEALDVHVDTVSNDLMKVSDLPKPKSRGGRPRALTPNQIERAKELLADGETRSAVCMELFGDPEKHKDSVSLLMAQMIGAEEREAELKVPVPSSPETHECVCPVCGRKDVHE